MLVSHAKIHNQLESLCKDKKAKAGIILAYF